MRSNLALAALVVLTACVSPEEHRRALGANQALQAEIASLMETQRALGRENEQLRSDVDRLSKQAADAAWIREQKAKLDELLARYQPGGSGSMEGVEVIRTDEGLAFRVLGGVLFAPGKIEIREQGRTTLRGLIDTLRSEGKRIRVDGHTDDQPIQHSPWKTNLRLSAERALAVAEFLIQSGLPQDQIGIAGYGEYRPAVEGTSEQARAQNRRVEIVMLDR